MKLRAFLATLVLLGLAAPVAAQPYPHRTVSVIVPYPAGGSVDVVARLVVQKLNESMGANFIVENRAGGAGGAGSAGLRRSRSAWGIAIDRIGSSRRISQQTLVVLPSATTRPSLMKSTS